MNDIKIVIDAGHGGEDPGSVKQDVYEKDLTLMISKYMEERFKELGVPVIMTRIGDESLTPKERVDRILKAYGNHSNVIVISNHVNATSDELGPEGAEVIYALRNNGTLAQNILDELKMAGFPTRKIYQRTLSDDKSKDYYFIHRETGNTTPLIIEYGFMNNPEDLQRIKEHYPEYVDAVVRAIMHIYQKKNPNIVTYIVKSGDSLWQIARRFGVSVETLRRINGIYYDYLRVGQVIQIPLNNLQSHENYKMYHVLPNDTLWSIARRFHTTVDSIKLANNLLNDTIYIGQNLKIPIKNHLYIVKYGDSLWKIARRFQTTVENLKVMNHLSNDMIYIGQTLKVM